MPNKVNTFKIEGDILYIMREGWDNAAITTYREDYIGELKNHVWNLKKGYPCNATLGGGLHRYVMAKWYGKEVLEEMTQKGYVVDHMNNNHMDCRISNLEFLKHNRNVAKGQYFDKESEAMRYDIAVSIFKDFTTGCYQLTIGCNANIAINDSEGNIHYISAIKLLYNCSYPLVILDAERILTQYDEEQSFTLRNMNYCDKRIIEAVPMELTEDEKGGVLVVREGKTYLILGTGNAFIHSVHYDEGWTPNLKK